MPSGRDSFRRNRVAPFVLIYFTTSNGGVSLPPGRWLALRTSDLSLHRLHEQRQLADCASLRLPCRQPAVVLDGTKFGNERAPPGIADDPGFKTCGLQLLQALALQRL
jgi:hypothetical protein